MKPPSAETVPMTGAGLTAEQERLDESEVIGGLLCNGKQIEEVRHRLEPRHFHDPHLGSLFGLLLRLESITLQTVLEGVKQAMLHPPGGSGWATVLSECMDSAQLHGDAEIPRRAERIRARSVERRRRDLCLRIGAAGAQGDDLGGALEGFVREARALSEERDRGGVASQFLQADRSYLQLMLDETARPPAVFGDGLLYPRQIGELHGADGSRKSFVSLHLLAACATGTEFFGIPTRAEPFRCGLISLEDDKWLLQERLTAVVLQGKLDESKLEENLWTICPPYFDEQIDITDPAHQAFIRTWIQTHGLELVVIDHLSRAHRLDDERDLRPVGSAGIAIARACSCAILFNHHDRKPAPGMRKGQDDPGASRGDSRFGADCRLRIALKETGENRIRLSVHKSTGSRKPPAVWLEHGETGALQVAPAPERSAEAALGRRARMREVIRQAGVQGVSPSELEGQLGLRSRQVRAYARELEAAGEIRRSGRAQQTRYHDAAQGPAVETSAAPSPDPA